MSRPTVKIGNIVNSDAHTLVNTVNCVGVMGKGIAAEFRKRFPEMYRDYVARCDRGEVKLGRPYLFRQLVGPWILNFPTKDHWRSVSRLVDIVAGLEYLKDHYREWGIQSLAVPPLGCGNGQLDWNVVGPTLYRHLADLDIPVELYAPYDTPAEQLEHDFLARRAYEQSDCTVQKPNDSRVPPAVVALVSIVSRVNQEPYHWPIGRTMFQKIAYFATEAGIPTGLAYRRGSYGPFSPDVKPLIAKLQQHDLIEEHRQGQTFVVRPGSTYRDAREHSKDYLKAWRSQIECVADLFLRLRTTTDAEIAATVYFVAKQRQKPTGDRLSELEVLEAVREWKNKRQPPLSDEKIRTTIRNLNILDWIELEPSAEVEHEDAPEAIA